MSSTTAGLPRAFSEVLRDLGLSRAPRLSLAEGVAAFGERAFAAVMLLVALLNLLPWPPGGTTVLGLPLILLSLQLMRRRRTVWLPVWMMRAQVDRRAYRRFLRYLVPPVRWVERLSRPRLPILTGRSAQMLLGLVTLVLAVILTLPIPFGNLAPATAIAIISLGVMQRDGVMVLLGLMASAFSIGLLVVAWALILGAFQAGLQWLGLWPANA